MFMAPLTVPAYLRPMSRQAAQLAGIMQSMKPKPKPRKIAASVLLWVSIAASSSSPAIPNPAAPTVRRAIFSPYFFPRKSLVTPPIRLPQAPRMNGSEDHIAICAWVKPRPLTR